MITSGIERAERERALIASCYIPLEIRNNPLVKAITAKWWEVATDNEGNRVGIGRDHYITMRTKIMRALCTDRSQMRTDVL